MCDLQVNDIKLSENTQQVLREWQEPTTASCKSTPERYVDYLNDAQDLLIRHMLVLMDGDEVRDVNDVLTKLILIKDDIKMFIVESNHGPQ